MTRRRMFRMGLTAAMILGAAILAARAAGPCDGVAPADNTSLESVPVVTGLNGRPLYVTAPPGDRDRLFVVEQSGFIRIKRRGDATGQVSTFLDLSGKVQASTSLDEMGLLSMAFDPDYATNGFFYVDYTEGPLSGPWFSVLARYAVSAADPNLADPGSELRLLRFQQPESNHNGGQILFGPDGYLYLASGDGGGGGDGHGTCGNGQNRGTLLGKFLRIDVRGIAPVSLPPDCGGAAAPYRIPADNPFADGALGSCDEIWSYGLRNPWRSTFDRATGDFYIADVGQNCWEEINYIAGAGPGPISGPGGQNFGWRAMEANHCFNPAQQGVCDPNPVSCSGVPPCFDPSLRRPILEYSHAVGCSITGGLVYRGCLMPKLLGTYFYGDYCAGSVSSLRVVGGAVTDQQDRTAQIDPAASLPFSLTSFGEDAQGEIYVVNRRGTILRVLPPFRDLEVSGPGGGSPLAIGPAGWSWGDLAFETMHPVSFYRVYRGLPGRDFTCIFTTPTPSWSPGDPALPAPGALFAYLVTAVAPDGQETKSGGSPAVLSRGACP